MTTQKPVRTATDPGEFDRLAVLTIQGGGVYGLNMLGQLAAVIDHYRITPLAYAGTSAGAVVAALSWAGYSPKEMRELFVGLAVDGAGSQADGLAPGGPRTVVDLLGPIEPGQDRFDYEDFKHLAVLAKTSAAWIGSSLDPGAAPPKGDARSSKLLPYLILGAALLTFAIVLGLAAIRASGAIPWLCWCGVLFAIISGLALGVWRVLGHHLLLVYTLAKTARKVHNPGFVRRGFFPGDHLERFIDRCLKDSPRFKDYAHGLGEAPVTFGWVDSLQKSGGAGSLRGIVPLILTATNLTTRELILIRSFDDRFHSLSVARSVRASAGFPVFFRPVDLRAPNLQGWYVDGGMISNFPAWVFSRELRRGMAEAGRYKDLAIRPWLNIGLRVVPDRTGPPAPDARPSEFLQSLFDLARGQVRNELEDKLAAGLPRTIPIMQPKSQTNAPANIHDVDQLTDDKIRAMFARGEEFAKERFSRYSFTLPTGAAAAAIERALERVLVQILGVFHQADNDILKLRNNVFMPRGQELVLTYSLGMGDDPDRDLRFKYDAGLTGFCFRNRRPFLCNLSYTRQWAEQAPSPDAIHLGMRRDDHLAVREDRTWLASVPIFDPVDCWFLDPDAPRMERDPEDLESWTDFPGTLDGAVFGVLNLDGAIPYEELGLPKDPERSLTDPRLASIFSSLQACSFEVGRIFSQAFGRETGS